MNHKFTYLILAVLLLTHTLPNHLLAQSRTDEVMVSDCNEEYEFKIKGGQPIVKNKISITYHLLRDYEVPIQPAVFYGDNIRLDGTSCSNRYAEVKYRSATPENVFFDDSRVCYYNVKLQRRFRQCTVTFERTFTDVRYFTRVLLGDEYYIKHKTVTFVIPNDLSGYRLVEKNLTNAVQVERMSKGGKQVVKYVINNMDAMRHEQDAPLASQIHPIIYVVGSFKDAADMFAWSRSLSDVDTAIPELDQILNQVNQGTHNVEERIQNTLAWVQNNVRYVAFEAGVSKHQPDRPAEVLRKRYGDCKGMALLLKTLLVAQGIDARLTDVGTREASCQMSEIPTLAAINHAICTVESQGKTYYLDATCRHIPLGHIPSNIQGMEAMVEAPDRDAPSLRRLPVLPLTSSVDSMYSDLALNEASQLVGAVSRHWCGDMKEMMLAAHEGREAAARNLFLAAALNDNDRAGQITHAAWLDKDSRNTWAVLAGTLLDSHSVQSIDGALFIEMDPDNILFASPIDDTDRRSDYVLPLRCRQVREVVLTVPTGYRCDELPNAYCDDNDVAELTCSFEQRGNQIIYRKVMTIHHPQVKRDYIVTWNHHLKQWNEHSHEQIVLRKFLN